MIQQAWSLTFLTLLKYYYVIYNFIIIIFRWFNSYVALNTQSNNFVQNMDRIWHATLDSNKLSYSFHNKVVIDFLEILANHAQLCYKHHKLIPKLTRSNITKKTSLSRLGHIVTPLHKLITGDLEHQNGWYLTIWKAHKNQYTSSIISKTWFKA